MHLSSCFFNVQALQPYTATGHTNAPMSRNLVLLLTDLFSHNLIIVTLPMASLDLTSLAQSTSFVTLHPKCTKEFTCYNLFAPTSILSTFSVFVIVFIFATFIPMLFDHLS